MAMKVRMLASLVVALVTVALSGCGHYTCGTTFGNGSCSQSGGGITSGGGGAGSGLVAYGYFTSFSSNGQPSVGIALQKLDVGAGTFIVQSAFTAPLIPPFPTGMVTVGKAFAYIPSADGTLYSFGIDSTTGYLTSFGISDPIVVSGGDSIAASADGSLIFVGDTAGQQISVYTVNADGSLSGVAGDPFSVGISPSVMTTDGLSKFLYATSGPGSTNVAAFSIGSGGVLTPYSGGLIASNVSAMAADPTGKYLLGVSWQAGDTNIHVYSINSSSGALTALASAPTAGTPRTIAFHPNGSWVYTGNEDPVLTDLEAIEGFDFSSSTGALTPISGSPFLDFQANSAVIEQSGQFLLALGHTIVGSGYRLTVDPVAIDSSTGALSSWPSGATQAEGFPGIDAAAYAVTDAP
jgi:6-phosphogluconolactonase (cycloisomerase 2 family)